ncbi:MAG: GGDEF domain-containing protein [Clostridia bacterium]|nr:GGDEF domain-containing protein [Clostridia bacterium]
MIEGIGKIRELDWKMILLAAVSVTFFVSTVVLYVKLQSERAKAGRRIKTLEKEVRCDYLTGALTRRAFISEMESELAVKESGVLMIFDINGFKAVNDMYGHIAGDNLIKKYSAKLLKEFDKEIVGRLGGDEFLVFISGKVSAQDITDRIKKSGAARFTDKSTKLLITSCCGAAVAPKNGQTFEDLYAKADKALYYSKTHDNTISFCREE